MAVFDMDPDMDVDASAERVDEEGSPYQAVHDVSTAVLEG